MVETKEDIFCPLCDKKMKKFSLENVEFTVDVCLDGCGGLYFDNRELKKISSDEINSSKLIELLKNGKFPNSDTKNQLKCPVCNSLMVNHFTTPSKRNAVDECYQCGGVFVKSDVFIKMLEELQLPPEKREKMKDYISSYMTPDFVAELNKENSHYGEYLKSMMDNMAK